MSDHFFFGALLPDSASYGRLPRQKIKRSSFQLPGFSGGLSRQKRTEGVTCKCRILTWEPATVKKNTKLTVSWNLEHELLWRWDRISVFLNLINLPSCREKDLIYPTFCFAIWNWIFQATGLQMGIAAPSARFCGGKFPNERCRCFFWRKSEAKRSRKKSDILKKWLGPKQSERKNSKWKSGTWKKMPETKTSAAKRSKKTVAS